MKAIPVAALLMALGATPVLAQQQYTYPSDSPPPARSQGVYPMDQQAQTPQSDTRRSGDLENLRHDQMSSPNTKGETVPESPTTGLPQPQARDNPGRLESTPKP